MTKDKDDDTVQRDELTMIYCNQCGTPLGKLGEGSTCYLLCPHCKNENQLRFKEGTLTQKSRPRRKALVGS